AAVERMPLALPALRPPRLERRSNAPQHPRGSAYPSGGARQDRELQIGHREGSPGRRGGERHRRRGHAAESVSEEGEKTPRRRRARVQVPRIRQLPRRVAPPPCAQDVDRLAHLSHGVREGCARRRRGRSRAPDRGRRAGRRALKRQDCERGTERKPVNGARKTEGPGDSVSARIRVVVDTNVWLDWLVFDDPAIAPIREARAANRVEICIDEACEAELVRVLAYDLGRCALDAAAQADCLAECRRLARRIDASMPEAERARLPACRDADDQKFLEAALAAGAAF